MPAYSVPPWLQPADTARMYAQGLQIGVGIAQANQRIAAERERMAMETQMRQQQVQAQMEEQRQRLQMQQAYHDQVLSLRQQQLEDASQKTALATRAAASKLAVQQQYRDRVQAGEDPAKVMLELGPAMGAGAGDFGAALRGTRGIQKPAWVPADPTTGAPGHFETPSGAVHIPPREPAASTALTTASVSELRAQRKAIQDAMSPVEPTDPKRREIWQEQKKEIENINRRIQELLPGTRLTGAPTGSAGEAIRRVVRNPKTGKPELVAPVPESELRGHSEFEDEER